MTVPVKQIRVGPLTYSIEPLPEDEVESKFGLHDYNNLKIMLADKFASPAQESTVVLHEIGHAIFEIMGLTDKDTEERTVSQMARGYAMIIRDNPELIRWIISGLI